MFMDRVILHCDINSFYASVELLEHPELKGRPVAVSGDPSSRHGIILAKNEPAKAAGVKTAETIWQARRKCPDLVLLPPHHEKYRHFNKLINGIFLEYTDQVEPFSIDESWLDVTGSIKLFGPGRVIADTIRERVKSELGISLSAGVSWNKIFAKMGSEYKKPDATTEITRGNYRDILWPLPVKEFFFVGRATADKLGGIGINTIGDLAAADDHALAGLLGKQGPLLAKYARGEDDSPVRLYGEPEKVKSVGNGTTFSRDLVTDEEIRSAVTQLADRVSGRLRKHGVKAGGVKVDIKDPSFKTISRQMQLTRPADSTAEIKAAALGLIKKSWPAGAPIRLITITGISLVDAGDTFAEQLSFFVDAPAEARVHVDSTVDAIREKFGDDAIGFVEE